MFCIFSAVSILFLITGFNLKSYLKSSNYFQREISISNGDSLKLGSELLVFDLNEDNSEDSDECDEFVSLSDKNLLKVMLPSSNLAMLLQL